MRRVVLLIAGVSLAIGCSSNSGGGPGGAGGKSASGGSGGSTATSNGGTTSSAGSGSGGKTGSGGVTGSGGAGSGGKTGVGSGGVGASATGGNTGGVASSDASVADVAMRTETGLPVDGKVSSETGGGAKDVGGGSLDGSTSPAGSCSRTTLQAAVDSYVKALQTKDTTQMNLAASVKYTESVSSQSVDKVVQLGQGIWQTALPDAKAGKGLLDEDNCATFTEVFAKGSHPYVLGTRLAINQADSTITEIGTIINDDGDWNFDETAYQTCSDSEDWSILSDADQTPADKLKEYAQAYFNIFSDSSATPPPWGSPCYRLEGGKGCTPQGDKSSPSCNVGIPSGINFTKTRWVVDVKVGGVVGITLFSGIPDSHMFRFVGGKIVKIHTLTCTGSS